MSDGERNATDAAPDSGAGDTAAASAAARDTAPAGAAAGDTAPGPVFSRWGIASAVLAVVCVVAIALIGVIWSKHHAEITVRTEQAQAMQAAAEWTGVLINMTNDNVEASLQKLRDGTVGQLNADFEASMKPYRDVVASLQARTTGRIEAVAIESVHHDLDLAPGAASAQQGSLPDGMAGRTDTVLIVASSVSQNAGSQPRTVRWNLRLGVSEVDGKWLVSQLESLR